MKKTNPDCLAMGKSDLFSASWYLARNPDVAASGIDPVEHYLRFGAAEGRDPGPDFCTKAYLARNPDVARAGVNPLLHYIRYGKDEGRDPGPLALAEEDLASIADTIRRSGLFDSSWYLSQYPSVAAEGVDPVVDYLRVGYRKGRNPGPGFDASFYLTEYQDVANSGTNPLAHYLLYGRDEGRLPKAGRARALERKLWGGFSRYALRELEAIKHSHDESEPEKLSAAWSLVVWHYTRQEYAGSLDNFAFACRLQDKLKDSKKWALVAACCYQHIGARNSARDLLDATLKRGGFNPDSCLGMANTAPPGAPPPGFSDTDAFRLHWINRVFNNHGLAPIQKRDRDRGLALDNLTAAVQSRSTGRGQGKISVIMPAYNASSTLALAIESILGQTWNEIELIVVDDCSTDDTFEIARRYAESEPRVTAVRQPRNMGAYAARNAGLRLCTGDFITVHDGDDWSHPQKLETQMAPLLDDARLLGSFSHWVRVDKDMNIVGGWCPWGSLIEFNHSSFLFRRSLLDTMGEWDNVRVAGDTEFIWRAEAKHGKDAFAHVRPDVPLAFSLAGHTSLTQATQTHVRTVLFGLRRTYREAARWWHARAEGDLHLRNDGPGRPFPAPDAILPSLSSRAISHVFVSDFSRTALASDPRTLALLAAIPRTGKTALFHWPNYRLDEDDVLDDRVFEVAAEGVHLLVPGDRLDAETVVIMRPQLLGWLLDSIPTVRCQSVLTIEDCAAACGSDVSLPDDVRLNIESVFGHSPVPLTFTKFQDVLLKSEKHLS